MSLVQIQAHPTRQRPKRLPPWLRKPTRDYSAVHDLKVQLRNRGLHTVCESARCPNMHECFARGTATFMILGNTCTRTCGFCSVPQGTPGPLATDEPQHVARMARRMGLRHVVITSVNRDELPDGGSTHFAATVSAVRQVLPEALVEVLVPDFLGDMEAVARVLDAGCAVFNHNMETVARLYRRVRPQAEYKRSLDVLDFARRHSPRVLTKSGVMVGLGESLDEVRELLQDLRSSGTAVATIGQYLQPRRRRLPVERYLYPEEFDELRDYGLSIGFRAVFSGPFVRSSYMADDFGTMAALRG
ncbi:MAG: lipoyl synthase [Bryobacterales bacterium]|nr:lipoyl synthase [Bryobacterales bacterium]